MFQINGKWVKIKSPETFFVLDKYSLNWTKFEEGNLQRTPNADGVGVQSKLDKILKNLPAGWIEIFKVRKIV